MKWSLIRLSKFLSLILRHQPEKVDLSLDSEGYADVDRLLEASQRSGVPLDRTTLEIIVRDNDKKRFSFSADGSRIRANQGHSLDIDLGLEPIEPPDLLYHGTATRFIGSIKKRGLVRGRRHHVHLSPDVVTAAAVGRRHGKAIILKIASGRMHANGFRFFLSANGIWLTEIVPPEYISFPALKKSQT